MAAIIAKTLTDGFFTREELIDWLPTMNPYRLGNEFESSYILHRLPNLLKDAPLNSSSVDLAKWLSETLSAWHVFDPYKTLAIALVATLKHPKNPKEAIAVAVNHSVPNPEAGGAHWFQDIDCYGSVTGAIAGASAGISAISQSDQLKLESANLDVYHISLPDWTGKVVEMLSSPLS